MEREALYKKNNISGSNYEKAKADFLVAKSNYETAVNALSAVSYTHLEFFTKQSPLFNADKINTPLLLLHGNADTNVPSGESIQMFAALKIRGKTVEFVQVDGENHGIVGYQKRIGWQNTIYAWFAKWLKDEPEWWKGPDTEP